jgi:hypothetical protein
MTCGECRKWMCRTCPKESSDYAGSFKKPSCGAPSCSKFEADEFIRKIEEDKKACLVKETREQVNEDARVLMDLLNML